MVSDMPTGKIDPRYGNPSVTASPWYGLQSLSRAATWPPSPTAPLPPRRAARRRHKLTRYGIRMSTRPTPHPEGSHEAAQDEESLPIQDCDVGGRRRASCV